MVQEHCETARHQCDECPAWFISPFTLKKHKETHLRQKATESGTKIDDPSIFVTCHICGKKLSPNTYGKHLKRHANWAWKCEYPGCDREFSTNKALKRYMFFGENYKFIYL